jgi:hypothetical protein
MHSVFAPGVAGEAAMQIRLFVERSLGLWSNRRGVMEWLTALLFS